MITRPQRARCKWTDVGGREMRRHIRRVVNLGGRGKEEREKERKGEDDGGGKKRRSSRETIIIN